MRSIHKEIMKARARNVRLTVAYDGADYHGFQRQTPPVVAVQNVLENALYKVFGDKIELAAAGRTDAGVHALGQVVNFFTDGKIPAEKIPLAVNGLLPSGIAVIGAADAAPDFSALHSAKEKTYRYRVVARDGRDPFLARYAWQVRPPLDVAAMAEAAAQLVGTHDFSSFRAVGSTERSPIRTMKAATIEQLGDEIIMTFTADGFLYHMARNIVATLVDVGRGRRTAGDFAAILASRDRAKASPTAPAAGLYLVSVVYE